ncbi:MAG TPA: serine/threonine-protein kinase [Polyangiaceae bacterium]|nr:serine/threonine-protein kinase [Polyangiaceae bacterium]
MRLQKSPVDALLTLPHLAELDPCRANFRQAMAALGHRALRGVQGAPPLEGLNPEELQHAAERAIEIGLADDLDWLAPGPAALALYELSAALPPGKPRRELGRRVYARIYQGTASTFAAVASRMALTSARPFEAAPLSARVRLLFSLSIGSAVNPGPLALTLVTRDELRERWLETPRTGPLPARRLAAKLLEHAAREAVFRAQQGDPQPSEVLLDTPLRAAHHALLSDREHLVWRHAAVARGLLSSIDTRCREEIELSLNPGLSPLEWRRGAVSLVALASVDPEHALRGLRRLLEGPQAELDKGLPATLTLGLPRVIEAEPDAAEQILEWISKRRRPDVAEAIGALLTELPNASFAGKAMSKLRQALGPEPDSTNSFLRGLFERKWDRSSALDEDAPSLLNRALLAYEHEGSRTAFEFATRTLQALGRSLDWLLLSASHEESQRLTQSLSVLSDIDRTAFERACLHDLLLLGRRPGDTDVSVPELDRFHDRIGRFLLHAEAKTQRGASPAQAFSEQRRLRTLLHLTDVDSTQKEDDKRVRQRISRSLEVLLDRLDEGDSFLAHRIVCATLARACDAAVRENLGEASDVLLLLASRVRSRESYRVIAEASTQPAVRAVLAAFTEFLEFRETRDPISHTVFEHEGSFSDAMLRLSRGLLAGGSYRGEALRRVMLRLSRGLEQIQQARGQGDLVAGTHVDNAEERVDVLGELEQTIDELLRLQRGALQRLLAQEPSAPNMPGEAPSLSHVIERAVSTGTPADGSALHGAISALCAGLCEPIAFVISTTLSRIGLLPLEGGREVFSIPLERKREPLPDWLLPHRTIGAFYVVRPLGAGGTSSVFLARRLEQRSDPKAPGFALKTPDYDPTTARSLSEQEFLQLFRDEASALLALPEHPNLARFVTFDVGAQPKPILVMELICGTRLDRIVRSGALTTERAFSYLDGILAGLEAMHRASVGHLDVKPSNVVLRDTDVPVLVDFGLSGRHLRPGCGTLDYCSPEVLGVAPPGTRLSPLPTDLYAFACTAFEVLTSEALFHGEDEATVLSQHLSHDGWPTRLAPYAHTPETAELAKLLAACLRRDPEKRPTATQARAVLRRLAPNYTQAPWPLSLPEMVRRAAS